MSGTPDLQQGYSHLKIPFLFNSTYFDSIDLADCIVYYPFWNTTSFNYYGCDDGWCHSEFYTSYQGRFILTAPTLCLSYRLHVANCYLSDTTIDDVISFRNYNPYFEGYNAIDNWACLHLNFMPKSEYLPGDANMYLGLWPPQTMGSDVIYMSHYFMGMLNQPCLIDGFWASADINGDCIIMGSDVKLVRYFKGEDFISFCPAYFPAWLTSEDIPDEPPVGWPPCETPSIFDEGKGESSGSVK
ncbi:MAG: hypothetical protein J7K40_01075 [candidate division Zixibacteria bacterium]|nr:hypothetical protein [candidate division Zixibacteria bacterium]